VAGPEAKAALADAFRQPWPMLATAAALVVLLFALFLH
jgi:hypothetical protein